jgi:hypothetical protein
MKIYPKDFCVPEGSAVNLKTWKTDTDPVYKSKKDYNEQLEDDIV